MVNNEIVPLVGYPRLKSQIVKFLFFFFPFFNCFIFLRHVLQIGRYVFGNVCIHKKVPVSISLESSSGIRVTVPNMLAPLWGVEDPGTFVGVGEPHGFCFG